MQSLGVHAHLLSLTSLTPKCHAVAQALADPEEAVIVEAVGFLASVTHAQQLRKRSLLAAIAKVFPSFLTVTAS